MGISKQPPKPFPITKGLPCQLKWTHSTVYLTDGESASCHRVMGDPLEVRNGELNFHNIPAKLEARRKMLRGEWPGRGCEHCKHIEEAGGKSDRQVHLNLEGTTAPPELDTDLTAVDVTPRQLKFIGATPVNSPAFIVVLIIVQLYSRKRNDLENFLKKVYVFRIGGRKILR